MNITTREVSIKIVYHGPDLCGKTSTLQYLHSKIQPEARSKLTSVPTETGRGTIFFDFVPPKLGELPGGFKARFHLYALRGPIFYDQGRPFILKGANGVVFVADSQPSRMEANIESLQDLRRQCAELQGRDIAKIPMALQYNKRDLPDAMPLEALDQSLRIYPWDRFDTIATQGTGVFEALKSVAKQSLIELRRNGPWT
jgi:GTPase SAR1 family protein